MAAARESDIVFRKATDSEMGVVEATTEMLGDQPTMAMLNNFMGLMNWLRRTLPLFSLVIKAT